MNDNIYQAPQSAVVEETSLEGELASRWARLGASILDSLILGIVIALVAFAFGLFDAMMSSVEAGETLGFQYNLIMSGIGIAAFLLVNGQLLASNGQTVGKKLMGIRIVDMQNQLLPLGQLIGKRCLPVWVASYLPGGVLPLIDALFVFRADKRCVHDLIAGTQVVNC